MVTYQIVNDELSAKVVTKDLDRLLGKCVKWLRFTMLVKPAY